jgi:GxxExxY protein
MLQDEALSYTVRGCVFEVYRELGAGFLEKVYERALVKELRNAGLSAEAQAPVAVTYKGEIVGEYFADILVEGRIVLELKAQPQLPPAAEGQLLNYLRATGMRLGLLVNFSGPRASIRRLVL